MRGAGVGPVQVRWIMSQNRVDLAALRAVLTARANEVANTT